jgi:hypothetical protein
MLPTPTSDEAPEPRQFPALTELQERFVHEYVSDPRCQQAAAIRAGYAEGSAHVTASRLMRNDVIVQSITHATIRAMGTAAPRALATIVKLSHSAKSEYVQLESSRDILDRLGMAAPKKVSVGGQLSVTFDLS